MKLLRILLFVVVLLPILPIYAQELTNAETEKIIKVQRLVRSYDWLDEFAGIVILAKNGKPIYKHTSGMANYDYNVGNALSSQYNLFGLTKTITATAILQLVENFTINLDNPISDYLVQVPEAYQNNVTVRHLLTHTSGIKSYYQIDGFIENFPFINKVSDISYLILQEDLQFEPGTQFNVSDSDYILLADIIERTSRMTYQQYIEKNILQKAGMKNSNLYFWNEVVKNKAIAYSIGGDGSPVKGSLYYGAYPFGADGIYCSADDLLLFFNALMDSRLLSPKYVGMMYKHVPIDDKDKDYIYSLGLKYKTIYGETPVIFQEGSIDGMSLQLSYFPEQNYTSIVFANHHKKVAQLLSDQIEGALFNPDYYVPSHPLAFHVYRYLQTHDIDYVIQNFNEIMSEKSLQLDRAWPLNSLGIDLMRSGQHNIALELLKFNMRKFPNEPMVYLSLADCYKQMGEKQLALNYYKNYSAKMPSDNYPKTMIRLLEEEANN